VCRALGAHELNKRPADGNCTLGPCHAETAGDPMGQRKWVRRSLRKLSHGLAQAGYAASAPTVSRLLKKHDYALRVNVKEKEAGTTPSGP